MSFCTHSKKCWEGTPRAKKHASSFQTSRAPLRNKSFIRFIPTCAKPGPPCSSSAMLSPPFLIKYSNLKGIKVKPPSYHGSFWLGWALSLGISGNDQETIQNSPPADPGWAPGMMSVLRILRHLRRRWGNRSEVPGSNGVKLIGFGTCHLRHG